MLTTMIATALAAATPAGQPAADPHAGHGSGAHHAAGHDQHKAAEHEGECKMACCKDMAAAEKGKCCAKHDQHSDHQPKPKA